MKTISIRLIVEDVVLTMFLSLPCAILMMVYKGYDE